MYDYIIVDGQRIDYNVAYRARKTVGISVSKREGVKISAPPWITEKQIREIVIQKSGWIIKKILHNVQRINLLQLENDMAYYHMGNLHKLNIICTDQRRMSVQLTIQGFNVFVPRNIDMEERPKKIRKAMYDWFKKEALSLFNERVEYYSDIIRMKPKAIAVKKQKTRWGSCSSRGNINLNIKLLMLPPDIMDYVIVHEMIHLKIMNHSSEFWKSVASVLPDYRNRIKLLKEYREAIEYSGFE